MLSAGNIPYCASQSKCFVTIYTTKEGKLQISSSKVFKELTKYSKVSFNFLPNALIGKMTPLRVMNICQRDALQKGFSKKRILLPFTADVFLTENLLKTGLKKIRDGYKMVVGTGLRINEKPVMLAAKKNKGVIFNIKNNTAVAWAKKHRHIFTKRQNINSKRFIYSAELYAETSDILISHCFGLAPFILYPEKLSTLPDITFDDAFIDKIFPNENQIAVLTNLLNDGGIYSVTKETSLSSLDLCSKDGYSPFLYGKKIFKLINSRHLGSTHLFYFKHLITYGIPKTHKEQKIIKEFNLQAETITKYLQLHLQLKQFGLHKVFETIKSIVNFYSDKRIFPAAWERSTAFRKQALIGKFIEFNHPFKWKKNSDKNSRKENQKKTNHHQNRIRNQQIYCLAKWFLQPLYLDFYFLSHCILNPHKIGGLISVYGNTEKKCLSISFLRKIRNAIWPFVIFFLSSLGSTVGILKIFFLKGFGLRGGKRCKIHRGVYFKNPWNVILRPFCEIGPETIIDAPSAVIECGYCSRISTRCVLSSTRATPFNIGGTDAINSRIVIPANSVLDIGTIKAPPK